MNNVKKSFNIMAPISNSTSVSDTSHWMYRGTVKIPTIFETTVNMMANAKCPFNAETCIKVNENINKNTNTLETVLTLK